MAPAAERAQAAAGDLDRRESPLAWSQIGGPIERPPMPPWRVRRQTGHGKRGRSSSTGSDDLPLVVDIAVGSEEFAETVD
jgi:hypothetical protein